MDRRMDGSMVKQLAAMATNNIHNTSGGAELLQGYNLFVIPQSKLLSPTREQMSRDWASSFSIRYNIIQWQLLLSAALPQGQQGVSSQMHPQIHPTGGARG